LCSSCNREKRINGINFRSSSSPLKNPKELHLYPVSGNEPKLCTLRRTINMFYHCHAVSNIKANFRKNGKYYSTWEIELNESINPEWLTKRKTGLIDYIQESLGFDKVMNVRIVSAN